MRAQFLKLSEIDRTSAAITLVSLVLFLFADSSVADVEIYGSASVGANTGFVTSGTGSAYRGWSSPGPVSLNP